MPKPVTLDDLAGMIKNDVVDRLDRVENRLDRIEQRLERIETVILTDHARRIERIEDALALPTPQRA